MTKKNFDVPEGYEDLAAIFQEALDQSSKRKGKERHQQADRPFDRQPICEIPRWWGHQGTAYQVIKKTQEAMRLPPYRACALPLGVMVYAATIKVVRESSGAMFKGLTSIIAMAVAQVWV